MMSHVDVVSVEEFIEAEEFTYDTVCGAGEILHENISWYRPRPLQARSHEWISPQTVVLRDLAGDDLAGGLAMGREVLRALGFTAGFTHMEWYRKDDGEVVFGEIGARPPGARTVDVMNYATDGDLFRMWAEGVVHGRAEPLGRPYNAASIFKRAAGAGHITRIDGLDRLVADYRDSICVIDLLPGRRPPTRLARHPALRRHDHRPAPRPGHPARDQRPVRHRSAAVRFLTRARCQLEDRWGRRLTRIRRLADNRAMMDHFGIQCADLAASSAFYDAVLAPLGGQRLMDFGVAVGYGVPPHPDFWIGRFDSGEGFRESHIAFTAPDRGAVAAFFAAATELGAEVLHEPRVWPEYHEHYFGAFVRDPDGNNVEAVCHRPEG